MPRASTKSRASSERLQNDSVGRVGCRPAWMVLVMLVVVGVSGCTSWQEYIHNGFKVGPNYARPGAAVANHWIDDENKKLDTTGGVDPAWWQTFKDPVLDGLVHTAYRQNLTLRVAGLRILEARALRGIAAGELFPQSQQAFGGYDRIAISKNGPSAAVLNHYFDEWTHGAGFAWELDFWGRFRRGVEAADAHLDASIENYDDVLVLLLSEVAQSYADVRIAEQRLEYAKQNVKIQKGSLGLANERFDNGVVTRLDVTQGQSNLAQTQATIPPLEASRRQAVNQLCILMGTPPHDLDELLSKHSGIPDPPPTVAVGIPAELLRRRPDIRRAEREVATQSALIGVAVSDLYPHFSITGTVYFDASKFGDLFDTNSFAGNVGPSFSWNVLNYGRLVNRIRVEESRFLQSAVQYQETVLQANAEAEDAIIGFLKAEQQVESLKESVHAASESVDLVSTQYREGKVDFNRVFDVQQFLTQQQDQLAVAEGSVAKNLIQLYKALGGGWQIRLEGGSPMAEQPLEVIESPERAPDAEEELMAPPPLPPANGKS